MRITFTRLPVKLDRERPPTCFQFTVQSKIMTHVVVLCVLNCYMEMKLRKGNPMTEFLI